MSLKASECLSIYKKKNIIYYFLNYAVKLLMLHHHMQCYNLTIYNTTSCSIKSCCYREVQQRNIDDVFVVI